MPLGLDCLLMEEGFLAPPEAPAAETSPLEGVVRRIQGGEREAFETLMALTEKQILAVAWRILGDRDLARDAAQEAYLRIYRSLDRYRLGEGFHAWMYRIAANVCYDLAKKRGPRMLPAEDLGHEHAHSGHAEEALLLRQRRALLQQSLQSLTPAERSALVLRDLQGLSTEETARALGVRPVTVRSQVAAARSKVQAFCAKALRKPGGAP